MQLGSYYRNDPETAKRNTYYFDDPKPIISRATRTHWFSNFLALSTILVASIFVQFTYSANVNLSSTSYKEFGQGIVNTSACSGTSSITITPNITFVNASGAGVFKVSGLRVDGVPLACQGVKFSISAYGDTSTAPVALYNTNATVIDVDDYSDGTFGVDLSAGLTVVTNSTSSFTVTFTNPVALASSTYKFTMQSARNETVGVQWIPFTIPNYSGNISAGTFGNGRYVFAGSGASYSLLTSTDGSNWTITNTTVGLPFEAATYGNGKFVLVTSDGEIVTTSDGVNYSLVQFPSTELFSVAYGNGRFVAVGGSVSAGSTIYTSTDGLNWTSTRSGSAVWNSAIFTRGGFYVAGRGNSTLLTSTNGTSWTVVQAGLQILDWQAIAETNGIFAISAINAVGNQYRSSDATTWIKSNFPGRTDMTIAASSGVFVGIGKENPALFTSPWIIYSSKDAQKWSERSSILGDQTVTVFYANREFYAVSDSGAILVSR